MKKYHIILGMFCLLAGTACSDDDPVVKGNNGNQTEEELPPLPTEVITGSRAMWVSYDPTPNADANNSSGISSALISWRLLKTDPSNVAFDIYKTVDGGTEVKLNGEPISTSTSWADADMDPTKTSYYRVTLTGQTETVCDRTFTPEMATKFYHEIRLNMNVPDASLTYSPDDIQVGDLDGDGELEIVLKREPYDGANQGGWRNGSTLLEAYKMDGTFLWQIDMGINIRSGSHYTSYILYDFDGDGCAEIIMKTSDGTIDGQGKVIGDAAADYREPGTPANQGRILKGNEYLTVFNGRTGAAMQTIDYVPARGNLADWGDNRANRSDRFLAAVAYLDGIHPSVVMCRGYYTRTVLAAFDWNGKELKQRWIFDSNTPEYKAYAGQGNHNLRVADVDGDGCDEIIYGSCAIDNNGKGLYSTGMGHGDAMHLTKFSPDMPGLQVWDCHENKRDGSSFRDAATGKVLFQVKSGIDVGRCMAADIDPTTPGVEMWSWESKGLRNIKGEVVNPDIKTFSVNMAVWWDGDLLRELLNKNVVSKYDWEAGVCKPLVTFEGVVSNNGTKATPCLQGDILGDWREEVLLRTEDNTALRLYVSPIATDYRFHTFLEDPVYRISIATQNVAYNQPTQPGFYFGPDLKGIFRGYEFKK